MVNFETDKTEQENRSTWLKRLYESLKKLVTENLKQKVSADVYDKDGVLGKKVVVAQRLFNDAKTEPDSGVRQRLLEQAAWILIETKQDKNDLIQARELVADNLDTKGVKKVVDKAIDGKRVNWSEGEKRDLKRQAGEKLRLRENQMRSQQKPLNRVVEENEDVPINEIWGKSSAAREEFTRLEISKEKKGEGGLSDREFDDVVDELSKDITNYAADNGIDLEGFSLSGEQQIIVSDLESRNQSLNSLDPSDDFAAEIYQEFRKAFAKDQHLLPEAERVRIRAILDAQGQRCVKVVAEAKLSEPRSRYRPEPVDGNGERMREIEERHSELAARLNAGEITPEQYQQMVDKYDVGDKEAYRAVRKEQLNWARGYGRRGATEQTPYEGPPLEFMQRLEEASGDTYTPEAMMRMRDPEYMFNQMVERVREEYGGNVIFDKELFEQLTNNYVMRILQAEASARSDYNIMQIKADLDLLIRSEKSLKRFGITDKERDDKRDQVGMVMAFFEAGIAGGSINMEQWVGMWKGMPTEGYADMLGFAHKMVVKYKTADGRELEKEVELKIGDFVDILYHEAIAARVMDRDFNQRRYGMELMAFYAIASQLDGWKDLKNEYGTTDFSKLRWDRNEAGDGFVVWMGDKSNAVELLGMGNEQTGSMMGDAEQLKNFASSLSKYVVNLELNVTLGLSKYNHNYTGHFNDQLYKHISKAYARKFGVPLYHGLFEAMDSLKRDPVSETYFKQNKEAIASLIEANGYWKKDGNGDFVLDEFGEKIADAGKVGEMIAMLQFLTTDSEGYHMTSEQMLKHFKALMIDRVSHNSHGLPESRLERLAFNKRDDMKSYLKEFMDNPNFNWQSLIFHHLGITKSDQEGWSSGDEWKKKARERLHMGPDDELPDWLSFKGQDGFRTFLLLETSSKVYTNKSLELQRKNLRWQDADVAKLTKLDEAAFAHDMAKQAGYLGNLVEAKPAMIKLATMYDMEAFVKFVESQGEGAYNFMTREQREWQYVKILLAKDKVFRRQANNVLYALDSNNSLILVGLSEEGTPMFERVEKKFYHEGHKRGAGVEPPWMSKWLIEKLWGIGAIQNKEMYDYAYGKSVETFMGADLAKYTINPLGWMRHIPGLEGFVPHDLRWGPGPIINWIRKEWRVLDKPKYVSDVFGEWMNIILGEAKKAEGLT
jgi:hypothetical protein